MLGYAYRVFPVFAEFVVVNLTGVASRPQHSAPQAYLHVLVFECPRCSTPVSVASLDVAANLESVDANHFNITCSCGWSGKLLGVQARKHFVDAWNTELSNAPKI